MTRFACTALWLALIGVPSIAGAQDASPVDRTELDRTPIVGNRELPKVLYIVPWKKPLPMPLSAKPPGGVLDEPPTALDRDVLQRQARLQTQLRARSTPPITTPTPTPAGEKR